MITGRDRAVYLDYNATTPCDPRVVEAMLPFFTDFAANSSSAHAPGRHAHNAIEAARHEISALVGASAEEIVFTSGATESVNLAIRGLAERQGGKATRRLIATTPLEHKAVLESCTRLGREGFEILKLPVDRTGRVLIDMAARLITADTLLVSIQSSNNEIGTIQPLRELIDIAHQAGAVFHCDAAQSVGKMPFDVNELGVDLMSFSSHKMYGPKGVGALYVRGGARTSVLMPIFEGGGQEKGLRPGTLNTPAIVGFGEACKITARELPDEVPRLQGLRDRLESELLSIDSLFRVNGGGIERLPNTSSVQFSGLEADALLANASGVAMSIGSACNSGAVGPSHVLKAIGLSDSEAYSTVRFSVGRFTSDGDIDAAFNEIAAAVTTLAGHEAPCATG